MGHPGGSECGRDVRTGTSNRAVRPEGDREVDREGDRETVRSGDGCNRSLSARLRDRERQ